VSDYLLDVNVVLALLDPEHRFHEAAHAWAERDRRSRWLTSPIVQNGTLRIASQPAYSSRLGSPATVHRRVRAFCEHPRHRFCPDDISLLEDAHLARPDALVPASVTDLYLLALARHHAARLATFDRRIPASAVVGGTATVAVIDA
jgi:uncharacterized protein